MGNGIESSQPLRFPFSGAGFWARNKLLLDHSREIPYKLKLIRGGRAAAGEKLEESPDSEGQGAG